MSLEDKRILLVRLCTEANCRSLCPDITSADLKNMKGNLVRKRDKEELFLVYNTNTFSKN